MEHQGLLGSQATGKPIISFSSHPNFVAGFHLVSALVLLTVVSGRKFYVALLLTAAYFATLLYAHSLNFHDVESAMLGWRADSFNIVVFVLLLPLLIWELTIVFRVLRQTLNSSKLT